MYTLILDTSTKLMYIILVDDETNEYKVFTRLTNKDHSRYIVNDIYNMLKENNLTPSNLSKIIVGRGPGSYTGLRVSGTVAKILSYTLNIKLYSVSSIYLLTSGYKGEVSGLINARRNNFFIGIYNDDKEILEDRLLSLDEIINIPNYQDYNQVFIDENTTNVNPIEALNMIREEDNFTYVPNYLRKTEAEINLE